MKRVVVLLVVAKSSLAVSLFPFHNPASQSVSLLPQRSTGLSSALTQSQSCAHPKLAVGSCYDLNTLLASAANFSLKVNNTFLTKKCPLSKNIIQCSNPPIPTAVKSTRSAKLALAVLDRDRKYKILISDSAGQNVQPLVISTAPITSLAWNKAGNNLAYVSYESGKPIVYIQNIYTAQRYIVANFNGSNSSPAFEGDSLLVSLSKDYGTHIYKIDLNKYTPQKIAMPLITSSSIDTEADYANGNLIFTSNKKGSPDIYLKKGNAAEKQISLNRNSITGRISVDGSKVLYVHGSRGRYDLLYYNVNTGKTLKIDSGKILSGSFAPDSNLIAYIKNNRIVLYQLASGNSQAVTNLKYREIYDVKWSK